MRKLSFKQYISKKITSFPLLFLAILLVTAFAISIFTTSTAEAATVQSKTINGCNVEYRILGSNGEKLSTNAVLDRTKQYIARLILKGPIIECASFQGYETGYLVIEDATDSDKLLYPDNVKDGKITAKYVDNCFEYSEFKIGDNANERYADILLNNNSSDVQVWRYFSVRSSLGCSRIGTRYPQDISSIAVFVQAKWQAITNPTNTNTNSDPPNNSLPNNSINTGITANIGSLDTVLGTFFNPLQARSVPELIGSIIRVLFLLVGIAAVIVIIIAGFRMVLASGNESELTNAKKAITWAIVGLIVSLMAFSIVAIIQNLISRQ